MEILNSTEDSHENNSQDLINASLIFARALGLILKENEGIVVDVKGDVKLSDTVNKIIVFKHNEEVHIYKCEEDLDEGTAVNLQMTDETPTE